MKFIASPSSLDGEKLEELISRGEILNIQLYHSEKQRINVSRSSMDRESKKY